MKAHLEVMQHLKMDPKLIEKLEIQFKNGKD